MGGLTFAIRCIQDIEVRGDFLAALFPSGIPERTEDFHINMVLMTKKSIRILKGFFDLF